MTPRVEISKRLVLINTASAVLAKGISLTVLVWLNQYLLRRISMEEYSLFPLLASFIFLLPLITSILTAGIGRYVLEAYARGDERGITQIVSTMVPPLLLAAVLMLTGGFVFAWYIDRILIVPPDRLWDARLMMMLLIVAAAAKPPCMAFSVGFYVRQKYVLFNLINVAGELLRLALLLVLLLAVSTRVLWVVVSNVTAELVASAVILVLSRRMIPALRFRAREIQWHRARELVAFGGWSLLGYIALRLREATVLFLLNRFATLADVTIFTLGYLGRRQIDTWVDVLGGSLYPVVTGMHALGAKERIRSIYLRGGRITLWITLAVAMPAMIFAEPIIRLYVGPSFLEAAVVMVLTLLTYPLTSGTWMIWQISNATGRVRAPNLYACLFQLTVMALVFYVVYGLRWGASGVALVLFAASCVPEFLILWPLGLRQSGATFHAWVRETLIPGLTPAWIASVVWGALAVFVAPDTWLTLGLCTLAGTLCYGVVLLTLCLEPRDRQDLAVVKGRLLGLLGRGPSASGAAGAGG